MFLQVIESLAGRQPAGLEKTARLGIGVEIEPQPVHQVEIPDDIAILLQIVFFGFTKRVIDGSQNGGFAEPGVAARQHGPHVVNGSLAESCQTRLSQGGDLGVADDEHREKSNPNKSAAATSVLPLCQASNR